MSRLTQVPVSPGWAMVGIMATSWRTPRGSTALSMAVGLVLAALLLATLNPTSYGGSPTQRSAGTAGDIWEPETWLEQTSTMPRATGGVFEHMPTPRRSYQRSAAEVASPPPLLSPAWRDPDMVRSPQLATHRISGSRSPPLS